VSRINHLAVVMETCCVYQILAITEQDRATQAIVSATQVFRHIDNRTCLRP